MKSKRNYRFHYEIGHTKNLAITSSYDFNATELFFIYFVIYSFNNGILEKYFVTGILIIWGYFPLGPMERTTFWFSSSLLAPFVSGTDDSKWNSVFIVYLSIVQMCVLWRVSCVASVCRFLM